MRPTVNPLTLRSALWHLTTQYAAVQNPIPPSEKLLFTFKTDKDLARWSTFSDQEFGGQSEASLALSQTPPVRGTAFAPYVQHLRVQASAVGSQSRQIAIYLVMMIRANLVYTVQHCECSCLFCVSPTCSTSCHCCYTSCFFAEQQLLRLGIQSGTDV